MSGASPLMEICASLPLLKEGGEAHDFIAHVQLPREKRVKNALASAKVIWYNLCRRNGLQG